ncbi:Rieske 2Fe-2S domain-containing protein [Phormidium nigroviride]|uniref:Rieske 2Fe-2S domain-containing protein n=1 Tax=Phormidium nigroviride TaxID=482564 RepID=UPI0037C67B3F
MFRPENGQAATLRYRCLHRSSPLSAGKVCSGALQCHYHGWLYNQICTPICYQFNTSSGC